MIRKYIPNLISASRVSFGLSGALWVLERPNISFWYFVVAIVTDIIDGPIARKLQAVSKKGALLDSMADWVLGVASFVALLIAGWLPWWSLILLGVPTVLFTIARLRKLSPIIKLVSIVFFTGVYALFGIGYLDLAYGWQGYHWLVLLVALLVVGASQFSKLAGLLAPKRLPEML